MTPLKFKSGTPGAPSKFKSGILGSPYLSLMNSFFAACFIFYLHLSNFFCFFQIGYKNDDCDE